MTEFEKEVLGTLAELKTLIMEDHKLLRGNGHPGLVDRMANLESQMTKTDVVASNLKDVLDMTVGLKVDVELMKHSRKWWHGVVVDAIALVGAAVAAYCAFAK